MQKLPEDFFVHVKIFFAGRPLDCDNCLTELWYPYSESYRENSFYCMVLNQGGKLIVYQILCENCMEEFKNYDGVIILKKADVPDKVAKAINRAIVNSVISIIPSEKEKNKFYFSYFDPNIKEIDESYLTNDEVKMLIYLLDTFSETIGTVIEIID